MSAERLRLQQREDERGDLVGERRVSLAAEGRDLRALDGVEQTELRLDDARMRGVSAEFGADGFVQLDDVLDRKVANAAVSR